MYVDTKHHYLKEQKDMLPLKYIFTSHSWDWNVAIHQEHLKSSANNSSELLNATLMFAYDVMMPLKDCKVTGFRLYLAEDC